MNYWMTFGASNVSGLAPTFIQWRTTAGGSLAPPSISEPGSGGGYMFAYNALTQIFFQCDGATSGLSFNDRYVFGVVDPSDNFGFTLSSMAATMANFAPVVISGYSAGVAGLSQGIQSYSLVVQNYSLGIQNYSLIVQGLSLAAINVDSYSLSVSMFSLAIQGASLLGTTASSFGTNLVDPVSVFGFLKRAQEVSEGNETYTKASGLLDTYSRGSSQLLIEKTISDDNTSTVKS